MRSNILAAAALAFAMTAVHASSTSSTTVDGRSVKLNTPAASNFGSMYTGYCWAYDAQCFSVGLKGDVGDFSLTVESGRPQLNFLAIFWDIQWTAPNEALRFSNSLFTLDLTYTDLDTGKTFGHTELSVNPKRNDVLSGLLDLYIPEDWSNLPARFSITGGLKVKPGAYLGISNDPDCESLSCLPLLRDDITVSGASITGVYSNVMAVPEPDAALEALSGLGVLSAAVVVRQKRRRLSLETRTQAG